MLNIAHIHVAVGTNGPGRRFTAWVQGCSRDCPGCFNPRLQPNVPRRRVSPRELAEEALRSGPIDGVSLSGGEPFDQALGLADFLDALRSNSAGKEMTALAYTGYCVEELRDGELAWSRLLSRLDLLVDGPYREEETPALPLRGSANQRLVALSPAGELLLRQIEVEPPGSFEVVVTDSGEVLLTGFPPVSVVQALKASFGDRG